MLVGLLDHDGSLWEDISFPPPQQYPQSSRSLGIERSFARNVLAHIYASLVALATSCASSISPQPVRDIWLPLHLHPHMPSLSDWITC